MDFCNFSLLLTAAKVAISLLVPAEYVNSLSPPPTCPDVPSPTDCPERFIKIEFGLRFFQNTCPTVIDHGVRLELGLQSAASFNTTNWFPIRYYTPSLAMPSDSSLVELNSSSNYVTDRGFGYNSSLPLRCVNYRRTRVIDFICRKFVPNFTDDMELQLRWMQIFRRSNNTKSDTSKWLLDSIKISIWTGTYFSEILSENFSEDISYDVKLGSIEYSRNGNPRLVFGGTGDAGEFVMRYIIINLTDTSEFLGENKLLLFNSRGYSFEVDNEQNKIVPVKKDLSV